MGISRFSTGLMAATLLGATCTMVLPAASASADASSPLSLTSVQLPLDTVGGFAVDSATGDVFVSSGSTGNSILVTDLNGNVVTTLTGETDPGQLVLSADGSTLYAVVDQDEIVAFDTATLKQTALYSLGVAPAAIALAGGEVWFTTVSSLYLNELNISTSAVTTDSARLFDDGEGLVSSPAAPGVLVAGTMDDSFSTIEVFDVASGIPVSTTGTQSIPGPPACPELRGMSISSDGKDLLASCLVEQTQVTAFNLTDFAVDGSYNTSGLFPSTPAESDSGVIVVASGIGSPESIDLYNAGDPTSVATLSPGSAGMGDFTWSSDGGLYGLGQLGASQGNAIVLQIYRAPATVTVSVPGFSHNDDSYTITGNITSPTGFATPPTLAVSEEYYPGTSYAFGGPVGTVTADANGNFSFTTVDYLAGFPVYTFSFAGDGFHSTATTSATMSILQSAYPIGDPGRSTGITIGALAPAAGATSAESSAARASVPSGSQVGTSGKKTPGAVTSTASRGHAASAGGLGAAETVASVSTAKSAGVWYALGICLIVLLAMSTGVAIRRRIVRAR